MVQWEILSCFITTPAPRGSVVVTLFWYSADGWMERSLQDMYVARFGGLGVGGHDNILATYLIAYVEVLTCIISA